MDIRRTSKVVVNQRAVQQIIGREGETAALLSRCVVSFGLYGGGFAPRQFNRWAASVNSSKEFIDLMKKTLFTFFLIGCLMFIVPTLAIGQKANPKTVAVSFGGECMGEKYNFSSRLKNLIKNYRLQKERLCEGEHCENAFAYDLNGDKRNEYFVRLHCGATGNCFYGIFSDRPAKLRGTFTAWFFFIHKRNGLWSKISTYTREGGYQGFIESWAYRRNKYVQIAERTERIASSKQKTYYERMGIPKCP